MFEAFQTVGSWGVTVFVVPSMLHVGLARSPSRLLEHLGSRAFLVRMLVIDLAVFPASKSSDNGFAVLTPAAAADPPRRRRERQSA